MFCKCNNSRELLSRATSNHKLQLSSFMLFCDETQMSADQATMDLEIQFAMSRVVSGTLQFVGIIAVMSQVTWQVLLVVFPFAGACIILQVLTLSLYFTLFPSFFLSNTAASVALHMRNLGGQG